MWRSKVIKLHYIVFQSRVVEGLAHLPWTHRVTVALGELLYFSRHMEIYISMHLFLMIIVDFITMCSPLLRFFSNKSGRGRPGLSRGECHSV